MARLEVPKTPQEAIAYLKRLAQMSPANSPACKRWTAVHDLLAPFVVEPATGSDLDKLAAVPAVRDETERETLIAGGERLDGLSSLLDGPKRCKGEGDHEYRMRVLAYLRGAHEPWSPNVGEYVFVNVGVKPISKQPLVIEAMVISTHWTMTDGVTTETARIRFGRGDSYHVRMRDLHRTREAAEQASPVVVL